jgi:hypothetical protein
MSPPITAPAGERGVAHGGGLGRRRRRRRLAQSRGGASRTLAMGGRQTGWPAGARWQQAQARRAALRVRRRPGAGPSRSNAGSDGRQRSSQRARRRRVGWRGGRLQPAHGRGAPGVARGGGTVGGMGRGAPSSTRAHERARAKAQGTHAHAGACHAPAAGAWQGARGAGTRGDLGRGGQRATLGPNSCESVSR